MKMTIQKNTLRMIIMLRDINAKTAKILLIKNHRLNIGDFFVI